MKQNLILGTAGHIDHGKTSLIRALTGVDCDRLPEEKARGITIDIGFASLELPPFQLGIVDVPGHERFVKNMLAGATGIDIALLVIAADDSIMPQSREHFEILKLLGVRRGLIAITKADTVDSETLEVVELEIEEWVQGSFLEGAPIIRTSAHTGLGIDELKQALLTACDQAKLAQIQDWFRLPIDRSFTVPGHGTVVTGSVLSGQIALGDEVEWHKGDGSTELVRVRSLNNHGQPVQVLTAGQRGAINLAGVSHDAVFRGQELATPGIMRSSRVLTTHLYALADLKRGLKHRLPVRVHLGTAEIMATTSLLDADRLGAGEWTVAQFHLHQPVTAVWGQPFIIRDSSAESTLGGGTILQPKAIKLRRRHVLQRQRMEELLQDDPARRAAAAAWFAGFKGVQQGELVQEIGVAVAQAPQLVESLKKEKVVIELNLFAGKKPLLHRDRFQEMKEQILDKLRVLHEEHPLMTDHDRQKLLSRVNYLGDEAILQSVVEIMLKEKSLVGNRERIARADFKPKLSVNQRKLKDKIVAEHREMGFQPPDPASFANQAAGNKSVLKDIYDVACAEGHLVKISDNIFLHHEHDLWMRDRVQEELARGEGLTVAQIRDLLGTTRKFAVPLCEFLDRVGVTRREGDLRFSSSATISSLS